MKARIITTTGEISASLEGLPFTTFCQQVALYGFWLTPNHDKLLMPSQISRIELVPDPDA